MHVVKQWSLCLQYLQCYGMPFYGIIAISCGNITVTCGYLVVYNMVVSVSQGVGVYMVVMKN